jgi:hypothetical protein
MNFPFYVVTATQCPDCGWEQTVKVFQNEPTDEQKNNVGQGSICEIKRVLRIENDDDVFEELYPREYDI